MTKVKYNSIDVVKFIMSILVVSIHTSPLLNCPCSAAQEVLLDVSNAAVPFFFIVSGFLMEGKFDEDFSSRRNQEIVLKTLKHMALIYIIAIAFDTPLTIIKFMQKGSSFAWCAFLYLRGLFITGEQYNSWQFWYILSYIYTLIFILILMKLKSDRKTMIICGTVFLIIGVCVYWITDAGSGAPEQLKDVLNNLIRLKVRIFKGFFYVPLGMWLKRKKIPAPVCFALLATIIVNVFIANDAIGCLLDGTFCVGLFGLTLCISLKDSKIYSLMRNMSSVIYYIHMYVWFAYSMLVYRSAFRQGADSFIVTTVLCVLISFVYCSMSMKYRQKNRERELKQ